MIMTPAPADIGPLSSRLGIINQDLYDSAANLDKLKAAGFYWVRTGDIWVSNEKVKGVYNFAPWDNMQAALASRGMRPLWLLSYGNPLYGDVKKGYDYALSSPASQQAFLKYTVALVRHLPKGQAWEFWNEPEGFGTMTPEQFASLCDAVAQAIHAADPTAKVSTGGLAWFDTDYEDQMLAAGAANHVDAIGVHMYMYGHGANAHKVNADPERVLNGNDNGVGRLPEWNKLKAKYGVGNLPNWVTEGGYSAASDAPTNDPTWQTRMDARWVLSAWAAGFPMFTIYSEGDGSLAMDIINQPNTCQAIKTISTMANGRALTGFAIDSTTDGDPTKLNLLRMEGANDIVYALWMRTGTMRVPVPSGTPGSDMLGNLFTAGSSVNVDAAGGPIYLTFKK